MARYSDIFVSDSRVSDSRRDVDSKSEIAKLNLLPNELLESCWAALCLGIRTFLCLIVKCLVVEITLIQKVKSQNSTCYRMSVPRSSGTPCASVFGRLPVLC